MDPAVERLLAVLDDLVRLLDEHSEHGWASRLARDAAWIRAGDGYGLIHLLEAYGGMGSLNDVVLQAPRGSVSRQDATSAQARLEALGGEAYNLASALRREIDAEGTSVPPERVSTYFRRPFFGAETKRALPTAGRNELS